MVAIFLWIVLPVIVLMTLAVVFSISMSVHGQQEQKRLTDKFNSNVSSTGRTGVTKREEEIQFQRSSHRHRQEIIDHHAPNIEKHKLRAWRKQQKLNRQRARGKTESERVKRRRDKHARAFRQAVKVRNSELRMTKHFLASMKLDTKTGETKHGIGRAHQGSRGATGASKTFQNKKK